MYVQIIVCKLSRLMKLSTKGGKNLKTRAGKEDPGP
jgi:hypothetical protein